MTTQYHRHPAMVNDTKHFYCYNCRRKLIRHIEGKYKLSLNCPRCKAEIEVTCKEVIPIAVENITDININPVKDCRG